MRKWKHWSVEHKEVQKDSTEASHISPSLNFFNNCSYQNAAFKEDGACFIKIYSYINRDYIVFITVSEKPVSLWNPVSQCCWMNNHLWNPTFDWLGHWKFCTVYGRKMSFPSKYLKFWIFVMHGWILTKLPSFKSSGSAVSIGKVITKDLDLYQSLNFGLIAYFQWLEVGFIVN